MMNPNHKEKENTSLDQLLVRLKNEDSNYARISKTVTIVYYILIPLYIVLTILKFSELKSIDVIISGGCFVMAFIIFALFFRKYYKEYKFVDYSLPTIQMLKKAAWRYKPFHIRSLWILFGIILMDIGLTFDWLKEGASVIVIQLVFIGIIILAIVIGLILWYFKYKPIRDGALKMIREIES